jgi:hypothetical protein
MPTYDQQTKVRFFPPSHPSAHLLPCCPIGVVLNNSPSVPWLEASAGLPGAAITKPGTLCLSFVSRFFLPPASSNQVFDRLHERRKVNNQKIQNEKQKKSNQKKKLGTLTIRCDQTE